MKTLKKSIAAVIALILTLFSLANAQMNEDQQRERDIKIAEGIIAEIFGDERSKNYVFSGFQNRDVNGEYIPGFGVHFTISAGFSNFMHIRNVPSEDSEIRIEVGKEGNSSTENGSDKKDAIREKIYEYMTKYAALISGVPAGESIRVTYAQNQSGPSVWIFSGNAEQSEKSQTGISVWAKVSDLRLFKNGDLSEQQLMNRIQTQTLDSAETYTDFNVFASVLETALNSAGTERLRVTRKPQMDYLPGLGVRYRVHVSTRPGFILDEMNIFDGNFELKMDSVRLNLNESMKLMEESLSPLVLKLDSMFDSDLSEEERQRIRSEVRERQHEIRIQRDSLRQAAGKAAPASPNSPSPGDVDLQPEADAILGELLNAINNYGSTLTSLKDEELLMISVNWSVRSGHLPERTEVRIKKNDLLRGKAPEIEEIERR